MMHENCVYQSDARAERVSAPNSATTSSTLSIYKQLQAMQLKVLATVVTVALDVR